MRGEKMNHEISFNDQHLENCIQEFSVSKTPSDYWKTGNKILDYLSQDSLSWEFIKFFLDVWCKKIEHHHADFFINISNAINPRARIKLNVIWELSWQLTNKEYNNEAHSILKYVYKEMLKQKENNNKIYGVLHDYGIVKEKLGDAKTALQVLLRVENYLKENKGSLNYFSVAADIIPIYISLTKYKEAVESANILLINCKNLKNNRIESSVKYNLSLAYFHLGEIDLALETIQASIAYSNENISLGFCYSLLAKIQRKKGNLPSAKRAHFEAHQFFCSEKNSFQLLENSLCLSITYLVDKQFLKSYYLARFCFSTSTELKIKIISAFLIIHLDYSRSINDFNIEQEKKYFKNTSFDRKLFKELENWLGKSEIDIIIKSLEDASILTKRQLEIIDQIRLGYSNKKIAKNLNIEECTVKFHVKNILKILNFTSRKNI